MSNATAILWDYFYDITTTLVFKWYPLIMLLTPLFMTLWFYLMAVAVHIYKWRKQVVTEAYNDNIWDGLRITLAAITDAQGHFWHNYEIKGLENLPKKGGALLIGYHGALPLDAYYLIARMILDKKRKFRIVVDKFLFQAPGLKLLMRVFNCMPGTISDCVEALNNGEILMIYPGGLRESLLSDEKYELLWRSRLGFSRVALEAEVPIIPFFTKNIREACRSVKFSARFASWLYEKTRLPLLPLIGIFPVELTTYLGKPIYIDDEDEPIEVAKTVTKRVEFLIKKHQVLPGSILRELYNRFWLKRRMKKSE